MVDKLIRIHIRNNTNYKKFHIVPLSFNQIGHSDLHSSYVMNYMGGKTSMHDSYIVVIKDDQRNNGSWLKHSNICMSKCQFMFATYVLARVAHRRLSIDD